MRLSGIKHLDSPSLKHGQIFLSPILLVSRSVLSNSVGRHGLQHAMGCSTPWVAARQDSLSIASSQSLLKLISIESMPSKHLIFYCPLLLLPSIFPSIMAFSNKSTFHIRPKYWSFSFSISPSNEYSGFISFRIDWLDLLAVQGILKSLLQHYNSKASIFWHFFILSLSHPYKITEKTIDLTKRYPKRYSST